MAGFAEMLAARLAADENEGPKFLPEAAIMRLREAASAYAVGCPFKVGDIVTLRKGYNIKGDGDPAIVVEVASVPHRTFDDQDPGAQLFGMRLDMRTVCIRGDRVCAHWQESWHFEPYTGEGA